MDNDLLYNWGGMRKHSGKVELNDETLRDGLQATYVRHPSPEDKKKFLDILALLGIHSANIGFPAASPMQERDVRELLQHVKDKKYNLQLDCGARTLISDIDPALRVMDAVGYPLEIGIFIGSSKVRQLVEKWELRQMGTLVSNAVSYARKHGAKVMFVTEDTTRAHPKTLEYLYKTAIDSGASRLCICDTVGVATPMGVQKLIKYFHTNIIGSSRVKVDWHGHNDRGLAVANSLAAADSGVDRIQATALGVGDRAGNTAMEELCINLWMEKRVDMQVKYINRYTKFASQKMKVRISPKNPLVGSEVFSTSTGVHAAAIKKAFDIGRKELGAIVYSAIDPSWVGRRLTIKIGPMSGKANVLWVLGKLGMGGSPDSLVSRILEEAKKRNKIFSSRDLKLFLKQTNNI